MDKKFAHFCQNAPEGKLNQSGIALVFKGSSEKEVKEVYDTLDLYGFVDKKNLTKENLADPEQGAFGLENATLGKYSPLQVPGYENFWAISIQVHMPKEDIKPEMLESLLVQAPRATMAKVDGVDCIFALEASGLRAFEDFFAYAAYLEICEKECTSLKNILSIAPVQPPKTNEGSEGLEGPERS